MCAQAPPAQTCDSQPLHSDEVRSASQCLELQSVGNGKTWARGFSWEYNSVSIPNLTNLCCEQLSARLEGVIFRNPKGSNMAWTHAAQSLHEVKGSLPSKRSVVLKVPLVFLMLFVLDFSWDDELSFCVLDVNMESKPARMPRSSQCIQRGWVKSVHAGSTTQHICVCVRRTALK